MSAPRQGDLALPPIVFHVTGFGKFRGVLLNPTSEAVPRLRDYFASNHAGSSVAADRVVLAPTRVLEVAGEAVDEQMHELRDVALTGEGKDATIVFLHFGVAAGAPAFALEMSGYNEASFRVPDERGSQPFRAPIDPDEPFAARHLSLLPVPALVAAVGARCGLPVVSSQDPGRFLCNWIYYRSLCMSEDLNARAAAPSAASAPAVTDTAAAPLVETASAVGASPLPVAGARASVPSARASSSCGPVGTPRFASLFCHVPSYETADLSAQLRFASALVSEIAEALHVGFDAYMARHCPRRPALLASPGAAGDEDADDDGDAEHHDDEVDDGESKGTSTSLRGAALAASSLAFVAVAGSGSAPAPGSRDDEDDDDDDDALYDGRPAADIAAARRAQSTAAAGADDGDFAARLSAAKSGDVTALQRQQSPPAQLVHTALRGGRVEDSAASAASDAAAAAAVASQLEALGFEPSAVARAVADTRKPTSATAAAPSQEVWLQEAADLLMARLEGGSSSGEAAPVAQAQATATQELQHQLQAPAVREARSSSGASGFIIAGKRESMVGIGARDPAAYASSSATAFSATALRGTGGSPVSDASACDVGSARSASVPPPAATADRDAGLHDADGATGRQASVATGAALDSLPDAPTGLPRLLSAPSGSVGAPSGTPQLHLPFSIHGSPGAASAGASAPPSSVAGIMVAPSSFALPAPSAFPSATGSSGSGPLIFDLSAAAAAAAAAPAGGPGSGGVLPPRTPASAAGGPTPDLAAAFSAFVASAMQSSSAAASSGAAQYKMVIVVRADLGMSAGKIAAQCCHAALKAAQSVGRAGSGSTGGGSAGGSVDIVRAWQRQGEPIVVVKCDSLEHLETLRAAAAAVGLPASTIRDAGRTQVDPGTTTVMAVGPARREQVDEVTGGLKLL